MSEVERQTVVLVPFQGAILPECEQGLRDLEARGYAVQRQGGYANVDMVRSQMATDALAAGYQWLMWIDSDIGFLVDDVARLHAHCLPAVAGVYVKKGKRELACHFYPETETVVFGEQGGLMKVRFAATGFLLTHRDVYRAVQQACELPVCNRQFQRPLVPYFMPMVLAEPDGDWYLGDDYAFGQRLFQAGIESWVDTTIRLQHYGRIGYMWEDAGSSRKVYRSYRFRTTEAATGDIR